MRKRVLASPKQLAEKLPELGLDRFTRGTAIRSHKAIVNEHFDFLPVKLQLPIQSRFAFQAVKSGQRGVLSTL